MALRSKGVPSRCFGTGGAMSSQRVGSPTFRNRFNSRSNCAIGELTRPCHISQPNTTTKTIAKTRIIRFLIRCFPPNAVDAFHANHKVNTQRPNGSGSTMAVRQAQCPHSNRTKPKIKSYQSSIAIHYSLLAIVSARQEPRPPTIFAFPLSASFSSPQLKNPFHLSCGQAKT